MAGPELLSQMGLSTSMLNHTTQGIRSVNGKQLEVMGYIYCKISIKDLDGEKYDAYDAVYIVKGAPSVFLSLDLCKALGIDDRS